MSLGANSIADTLDRPRPIASRRAVATLQNLKQFFELIAGQWGRPEFKIDPFADIPGNAGRATWDLPDFRVAERVSRR